jgi:hypothetical protein
MRNQEQSNTGKSIAMTDAQKLDNFMRILSMDPVSGNMIELNHEFKATQKTKKSKTIYKYLSTARCVNCGRESKFASYCSIKCEGEILGVQIP